MNIYESEVLKQLATYKDISQRKIAKKTNFSLGTVNASINQLISRGFIDDNHHLTSKAINFIDENKPKRAIILAAGFGMRMVPINTETPKALLQIKNETIIERLIKQLKETSIDEIYVVVGFMKEQFEFLIDTYDVKLIVNTKYNIKNNLYSLYLASDHLENSYIIPADIWCENNPFSANECYSWYLFSKETNQNTNIHINRKYEIIRNNKTGGNQMIGICYLTKQDAQLLKNKLCALANDLNFTNSFWEEALYEKNKMIINALIAHDNNIIEINTYEQLREIDKNSNNLQTNAINVICNALNISSDRISNIKALKKGMTNRSFIFTVDNRRYIMRIPGEGTDKLINRSQEKNAYMQIKKYKICDDLIYINDKNGYKITSFIENSHACDPKNPIETQQCMNYLKTFHELNLKVEHEFNIFQQIDFYEQLRGSIPSIYRDYQSTKEHIFSLKPYIENNVQNKCLSHIDSVYDNFIFDENNHIKLIDWEYSGMQDPHVDIAMFCIYALYDREEIDLIIDQYFDNNCPHNIRIKIYCYIAACGLLWSNWCEYKRNLGIEFGEYALKQYRYAKEYYKIAIEAIKKQEDKCILSNEQ